MADYNDRSCTREEALVLEMIKVWPGVPAIVTYSPPEGWSVGTHPDDVERYLESRSRVQQ
jgi:hypothetical protein